MTGADLSKYQVFRSMKLVSFDILRLLKGKKEMFEIKKCLLDQLSNSLLEDFCHNQQINQKWVRIDNYWVLEEVEETRSWGVEKKAWIPVYLKEQVERGGFVFGAFFEGTLIGFISLDGYLRGSAEKYANLTMLFIDDRFNRRGLGTCLFERICEEAKEIGATKLFISAIPSVETIAFYKKLGCMKAQENIPEYIDTQEDYCLEFLL